jgi:hypothetical protein
MMTGKHKEPGPVDAPGELTNHFEIVTLEGEFAAFDAKLELAGKSPVR